MSKKVLIAIVISLVALAGLFFLLKPTSGTQTTSNSETSQTKQETKEAPEQSGSKTQKFSFSVQDGTVEGPDTSTVAKGDEVILTVTSNVEDELHLHGYGITTVVAPEKPAVIEFTADTSGQFELESHDLAEKLTTLIVRPQ